MRYLTLILVCGFVTACSTTTDDNPGSYAATLAGAEAKIAEARDKGHAWTTFEALLQQAAAASDAGDEEEAVRLATEARLHAELAIEQSEFEAEAWKTRVFK